MNTIETKAGHTKEPRWHVENWDAVTLSWLRCPDGAKHKALIEAAPDLLKACEAALPQLLMVAKASKGSSPYGIYNQMLAAIKAAKAEGRA